MADAVLYGEQALKLDPSYEVNRWLLIMSYIQLGDPGAALQVAEETQHPLPLQRLLPLLRAGDWERGAELAYAALADGTIMSIAEPWVAFALRMQARQRHDSGGRVTRSSECVGSRGAPEVSRYCLRNSASPARVSRLVTS